MRRDCPHGDPLERLHQRHRHHHGRRRKSLQFRLFAWAGATILVTGLLCGFAGWLTSGPSAWQRTVSGAVVLASRRFADVWDDDRARAALASEIATELDVGVTTRGPDGEVLETYGTTRVHSIATIPVDVAGQRRGTVEVFVRRFRGAHRIVVPLVVALVVLWGLSGLLARRLARPLADLASTATAIGRGELDRRTRVARHAPREVASLAEAIDDMASRIQRQMADQRELLAAVSHEVRSPLARIRLLVEMARPPAPPRGDAAEGDAAERDEALLEIDREVEEIDALVGTLLASSRLDFGNLDPRDVDAVAVARDALLRASLPVRLLDADPAMPTVRADPTLLARALSNLIDNARLHGGGVTRLHVAAGDGVVRFEVEDDGPGLGVDADKVFLAFHRQPGTHGALGLGLAIVARIAEAHGGGAHAEDRAEGGARIGFWLPQGEPGGRPAPSPAAAA